MTALLGSEAYLDERRFAYRAVIGVSFENVGGGHLGCASSACTVRRRVSDTMSQIFLLSRQSVMAAKSSPRSEDSIRSMDQAEENLA